MKKMSIRKAGTVRSHLFLRMAALAAALAGASGGLAATALPAQALQSCSGYGPEEMEYTVYTSPPGIEVENIFPCLTNRSLDINVGVNISKYVGNSGWQVVATGQGYLYYPCNSGRFLYTTSVTTAEGKPSFYCG